MKSLLLGVVCLILISQTLTQAPTPASESFPCNVANCQYCSFTNVCGLCSTNYILQINNLTSVSYCQQLNCSIANCTQCYQNNSCLVCASGYYVNMNGTCTFGSQPYVCPTGCLSCNSTTSCQLCQYGFNLQNGVCFANNGNGVKNCQAYFSGYACQLCNTGYMTTIAYSCTPTPSVACTITNCALCGVSGSLPTCK